MKESGLNATPMMYHRHLRTSLLFDVDDGVLGRVGHLQNTVVQVTVVVQLWLTGITQPNMLGNV